MVVNSENGAIWRPQTGCLIAHPATDVEDMRSAHIVNKFAVARIVERDKGRWCAVPNRTFAGLLHEVLIIRSDGSDS